MAALTASMVSCPTAPVAAKPFNGLSRSSLPCKAVPSFAQRTVSNGARTRQMLVWEPVDNKCAPFVCSSLAIPFLVMAPLSIDSAYVGLAAPFEAASLKLHDCMRVQIFLDVL